MTWTIYARNPSLQRVGQVDDFTSLETVSRFNDVGTWVLDMDGRAPLATVLSTPGYGIEVVRHEAGVYSPVFSGPMRLRQRVIKEDQSRLVLGGYDDNVWLKRRLAHPQPSTASPPYNSQDDDVRTGTCSTILRQYVNVNVSAGALAPRKVTGLVLGSDPVAGSTITGRARWQVLLDLLQELALAGGGLGFRIVPNGNPGEIAFQVYSPVDKTAAVTFSRPLGTLSEASYESAASEMNYAVVGGSGDGLARTIFEKPNSDEVNTWSRIESFVDRGDTTDPTELEQKADETLADGVGKTTLSLTPVDLPGQQYLTHYTLGDRVTVVIDEETVEELVREVRINLTPEGPTQTRPTIGTPGAADINRMFQRLATAEKSIRNLERR